MIIRPHGAPDLGISSFRAKYTMILHSDRLADRRTDEWKPPTHDTAVFHRWFPFPRTERQVQVTRMTSTRTPRRRRLMHIVFFGERPASSIANLQNVGVDGWHCTSCAHSGLNGLILGVQRPVCCCTREDHEKTVIVIILRKSVRCIAKQTGR